MLRACIHVSTTNPWARRGSFGCCGVTSRYQDGRYHGPFLGYPQWTQLSDMMLFISYPRTWYLYPTWSLYDTPPPTAPDEMGYHMFSPRPCVFPQAGCTSDRLSHRPKTTVWLNSRREARARVAAGCDIGVHIGRRPRLRVGRILSSPTHHDGGRVPEFDVFCNAARERRVKQSPSRY